MADRAQEAMRPDFINDFASLRSPLEKKEEIEEVTDSELEEQAIAAISLTGGWKLVDDYIQELENELDEMVAKLMAAGASFEEIGQKSVVKELTKAALEKVRQRIKDAREAVGQDG